jgi:hypothetical protein
MRKEAYYILFSGVIGLCWQQFLSFVIGILNVWSGAAVVSLWHWMSNRNCYELLVDRSMHKTAVFRFFMCSMYVAGL